MDEEEKTTKRQKEKKEELTSKHDITPADEFTLNVDLGDSWPFAEMVCRQGKGERERWGRRLALSD